MQQITPEQVQLEILQCLKIWAGQHPPNWIRSLSQYQADWPTAIGANVIARDVHGVTQVLWCGHVYTRRAGGNAKYGAAIWFSRADGTDGDSEVRYARLITFKALPVAETLPDYVAQKLKKHS